jgi:glycosyltransferase involved in cell wall biosynthesis
MARPLRLLVASHDASRTGAPLLLLTVLRWLRRSTDVEVALVLWRDGPLVPAFREVAHVTVLHPAPGRRSVAETVELGLAKVGLGGLGDRVQAWRVGRRLRPTDHDVLLLNGAGSALVVPHLRSTAPRVAYVHELDRGLTFSLRGAGREAFLGADRVLVVAEVVADLLVEKWGVDRERVQVLPGCVPELPEGRGSSPPPTGRPLVVSVGTGGWRKGIDLFLELASAVAATSPGVHFAWVGRLDDEAGVTAEAVRRGLALALPGEVDDPSPWLAAADVFVSCAREDPFPLVALEAGAAGLPVVALDSGGVAELLADEHGVVVPALDVAALAAAVSGLLADPERRTLLGARLRARVLADHTVDRLGPALWAAIRSVASPLP